MAANETPDAARFRIADIVFSLSHERPVAAIAFNRPYRVFETDDARKEADLAIRLHYNGVPEHPPEGTTEVFDSQTHWRLFEDADRVIVELTSAEATRPYRMAVLNSDLRSGDIYNAQIARKQATDGLLPDPLDYPLGQLMMVMLLSRGRGLMVHASGVDDNGSGLLFAGNSTDGKTTIAKLWNPTARVLNDDRIVIRRNGDRFWMYGTPWHGDFHKVAPYGLPIEKIFFLSHGPANKTEPVAGARAASCILTRSFAPFWSPDGMAFTLDLCRDLVDSVECCNLAFRPDPRVVDFVRCLE